MDDVEVRPLVDLPSLHQVEELQRTIWGMAPDEVVPTHQLLAATRAGGAVLGAFTPTGVLVGFCYGFVGLLEGALLFYSHMAGVRSESRGENVGFRLKCAQRQFAIAQGIDRMVWTFDPLISANAYFNLHKLGAIARRYYVNYYGEMSDNLNRGLESDRLEVDWWLRAPRVEAAIRGDPLMIAWERAVPVLTARPRRADLAPGEPLLGADAPTLRVEIPLAFSEVKAKDANLARAWRTATREAFLHYFGRGYGAVTFCKEPSTDPQKGAYLLSQHPEDTRS